MQITPLRQSDEVVIRHWARDYLTSYVKRRAQIFATSMSDPEIQNHINKHELVGALWHDVVHADYSDAEYVAVARMGTEPVGMILAEATLDPYIRLPVGNVRWIYVASEARRLGLSKRLLTAAAKWMDNRGLVGWTATIAADNQAATGAYRKLGLVELDVSLGLAL